MQITSTNDSVIDAPTEPSPMSVSSFGWEPLITPRLGVSLEVARGAYWLLQFMKAKKIRVLELGFEGSGDSGGLGHIQALEPKSEVSFRPENWLKEEMDQKQCLEVFCFFEHIEAVLDLSYDNEGANAAIEISADEDYRTFKAHAMAYHNFIEEENGNSLDCVVDHFKGPDTQASG